MSESVQKHQLPVCDHNSQTLQSDSGWVSTDYNLNLIITLKFSVKINSTVLKYSKSNYTVPLR